MFSWLLLLAGLALVVSAGIRLFVLRRQGVEVGVMRDPSDRTGVLLAFGGLGLLALSMLSEIG